MSAASAIRRVILLGHSGLIGRATQRLLQELRPDLRIVTWSLPELDLTKLEDALKLVPELGSDAAVIMLSGIKRQLGDSLDLFEANLRMVTNTIRALDQKPAGRFVYVSSAAVYGEDRHNTAISEETAVRPQTYYGVAKLASEGLLAHASAAGRIGSLLCVRPPLVFGPGDASRSYGPSGFVHAALENQPITLWGDGSELREFLFVDDLALLLVAALASEQSGALNAASGRSMSFRGILDSVARATGRPLTVNERPRSRPQVDHGFDPARLKAWFPAFAFTPFDEAVRRTVTGI